MSEAQLSFSNQKITTIDMNIEKSRVDKMVISFSSWKILVQIILMLPAFFILIYFGVTYINQCPIQPLINIYLIVTGITNLLNSTLLLLAFITANYIKRSSTSSPNARYLFISSLIGQFILLLFSIGWLIAGQIWIFGAKANGFQSIDPTQSDTYCQPSVFWNGFASIFITYGILVIFIVISIIRLILKCRKKVHEKEDLQF